MTTFDETLEKYAELAVKNGVNIQEGQTLMVHAPVSAVEFARKVAEKAYKTGAKHVYFDWDDDELKLTKFKYAPDEAFEEVPMWKVRGLEELSEQGAAFLSIRTPDPDLLKDIDPEKVATANKASSRAMEKYKESRMSNKVSWSIVSIPTEKWAKRVFPDMDSKEAVEKLWHTIFQMTRADREDPVAAWEQHQEQLRDKASYLNEKNYKKLHYSGPGTDLSIEFPKGYHWVGGGSKNASGTDFIPNIPTEEVFTLPLKSGVNGTVSSTKPLNYSGTLINEFSFTFENGRIVDFQAEEGYDTLKSLIESDEGSHYLGEVALVPHSSPISQSGLIFFNTLFDENASCHLAIGRAYPSCLEGGSEMSMEEQEKHGVNKSLVHVDFMIGSGELDINGETQDGKIEPVFRKGNWAF
ncbi:MAG TPA: aminopeptidase [Bacillales bacterium]|nr:aminopeptidase [Bacillales bacterium]